MPSAARETTPAANARKFIRDLAPNERFEGAFSIANAQLPVTKNGDFYLACLLGDKTGQATARRWSMAPEDFKRLPADGFVFATGRTQPFKGELQFIIETIEPFEPSPDEMRDLLPCSPHDVGQMFSQCMALLDTVKHPAMKALLNEYTGDEMLMEQFRQVPAAQMMHHAYLGGLLEHTLSLLRLADAVCPLYPKINRDTVLVGLFLHDLGKTREISYDGAFSYTERGELIGHIVEGAIMLHDKAQAAMKNAGVRFPRGLITVLQHIILSHHGVPEFGAAKVPATPEAILIHMLDNVDAKTFMALAAARPDNAKAGDLGGNFTEKKWALGTKVYKPDVLA